MAKNRCKDQLLETAAELFSKNGFHATGIDTIIQEADVSRMTLYYNFPSKDALIEAVIARHHENQELWLQSIVEGPGSPEERFQQLFDALGDMWNCPDYHGCPFINAAAEYSDPGHPVQRALRDHNKRMIAQLSALAGELGASDAGRVAEQLMIIMDGGAVRAQLTGDPSANELARDVAQALISRSR